MQEDIIRSTLFILKYVLHCNFMDNNNNISMKVRHTWDNISKLYVAGKL